MANLEAVRSKLTKNAAARGRHWGLFLLLSLAATGLWAADERPVSEVLGLSPGSLAGFAELQDHWLEWLSAVAQDDTSRAAEALDRVLTDARELGLKRLPDLSLGAAGRAVSFAKEGRFDTAARCLSAAERLDPGRSEVAFAAARVAELQGRRTGALGGGVEGVSRLFQDDLLRQLWRADLLHWALFVLLLTGALYVTLLMATAGVELFHDIQSYAGRFVPEVGALIIALILLSWPLLLPAGLFWLLVYWSILLWGYGQGSQRAILIVLWIVLGTAPIVVNAQRERVRVALAPTVLSIESLASERLQGSLFTDLAALRAALPDSSAVSHLIADLHCRLGEWDSSRALYEQLLEDEPENGSALLNLGVCYLHQGDQAQAMMRFQKAANTVEAGAAARFNMSQVLSELYRFREAERELRIAQRVAPRQVGEWLRQVADQRVIILDGGLGRTDEIREELVSSWRGEESDGRSSAWPSFLSLPVAIAFLVLAFGLYFIVRRSDRPEFRSAEQVAPKGSWRSTLLVGFSELENGRPLKGFALILVLVLILSLPWAARLGYRLPWVYGPGGSGAAIAASVGLGMFVLVRLIGRAKGAH